MEAPAEEGPRAPSPGLSELGLESRRIVSRRRQLDPLYYSSYLKVPELLSLQKPKSEEAGVPAHDELLFVITHQAYELWFKQILHELNSVRVMFSGSGGSPVVDERDMGVAVSRLERVREIQTLMLQQINVLETMSALDFLVGASDLLPLYCHLAPARMLICINAPNPPRASKRTPVRRPFVTFCTPPLGFKACSLE
jgi:hypothetical protein